MFMILKNKMFRKVIHKVTRLKKEYYENILFGPQETFSFRHINTNKGVFGRTKDELEKLCPPLEKQPQGSCDFIMTKEKEKNKVKVAEAKNEAIKDEEEEISLEPLISTNYDNCKIVIIGAGMAGIAAAQYFQENNVNNYVILEALERSGGRIHSEWFGDSIVELGSNCIQKGNENYSFLQSAMADGLIEPPITHTSIFSTCDGHCMNSSTGLIAYEIFKKLYCESIEMDVGKFDYMSYRLQQATLNFPPHLRQDAARIMLGLFAMMYKRGDNLQFINTVNNVSYLQVPGGSIRVPLGHSGSIQPMLDQIPKDKIKLNKPVQSVRWGAVVCKDTPRALVKCCDGSIYPADYVIVTVSLGVLKASSDSLFCPALPAEKVEAMRALSYQHLNHIYFKVSEPFWSWSTREIKLNFSEEKRKIHCDWRRGITKIYQIPGSNNVLCVVINGDSAKLIEKKDQGTIAHGVMEIIREEMKILCVPSILDSIRSRWSSNVYFHGAFSCLPLGVSEEVHQKLASPLPGNNAPVNPILFFAGEATCPKLHATVQGAKISGIREAARIKRSILSSTCAAQNSQEKIALTG